METKRFVFMGPSSRGRILGKAKTGAANFNSFSNCYKITRALVLSFPFLRKKDVHFSRSSVLENTVIRKYFRMYPT